MHPTRGSRLTFPSSAIFVLQLTLQIALAELSGWQTIGPNRPTIVKIFFDRSSPGLTYALGDNGKFFVSRDLGRNWSFPGNTEVYAAAVDPFEPGAVYAASGSVRVSRDGGATWTRVSTGLSRQTEIWMNPVQQGVLYSADFLTFWKSSDYGKTWQEMETSLPYDFNDLGRRAWLAVSPSNGNILYAASTNSQSSGVARSEDGGDQWNLLNLGNYRAQGLLVHSANPNVVFVGVREGVLKSTNAGMAWELKEFAGGGVASLLQYGAGAFYAACVKGLYRSVDGGESWNAVGGAAHTSDWVTAFAVSPGNSDELFLAKAKIYPDFQVRSQGLFLSDDSGQHWFPGGGPGLETSRMGVVLVAAGETVYAGRAYPDSGLFRSDDAGGSWEQVVWDSSVSDQFIGSILMDPFDGSRILVGTRQSIVLSENGGQSWGEVGEGLPARYDLQVASLAASPTQQNRYFAATSAGLYQSSDGAQQWEQVTSVYALAVAVDPTNGDRLMRGDSAGCWRSEDGGQMWTLGLATECHALAYDPQNPDRVYAGGFDGAYRSLDGGTTFEQVFSDSGPASGSAQINRILVEPGGSNRIWLATNFGVLLSSDGGTTWGDFSNGLNVNRNRVFDLAILQGEENHLLAAVYGSSSIGGGVQILTQFPTNIAFPFHQHKEGRFVGYAVSNYGGGVAELAFTAHQSDGSALESPSNPSQRELLPLQQLAELGSQLVGVPEPVPESSWIRLSSSVPTLGSFFQFGDFAGTELDGSVALTGSDQVLYFSRVMQGATALNGQPAETILNLVNPHEMAVNVNLELIIGEAAAAATSVETASVPIQIPSNGSYRKNVAEIFGLQGDLSDAVVRAVAAGPGVIGFETMQATDAHSIIGLNGHPPTPRSRLYSAQLAVVRPTIYTNLRLFNSSSQSRRVLASARDEVGDPLAAEVEITLPPLGLLQKDLDEIFSFSGPAVGSLVFEIDGPGVIGDVLFGDPENLDFAAALPLQGEPFVDGVFSQVAETETFFTGLAFFNPNDFQIRIQILVFNALGGLTGEHEFQLAAGARTSQLLSQWVSEASGQVGGLIRVRAEAGIIAQQLFGLRNLRLMSAVPANTIWGSDW